MRFCVCVSLKQRKVRLRRVQGAAAVARSGARRWRVQVRGVALRFQARHNHAAADAAAHRSQVEKVKCKLCVLRVFCLEHLFIR